MSKEDCGSTEERSPGSRPCGWRRGLEEIKGGLPSEGPSYSWMRKEPQEEVRLCGRGWETSYPKGCLWACSRLRCGKQRKRKPLLLSRSPGLGGRDPCVSSLWGGSGQQ